MGHVVVLQACENVLDMKYEASVADTRYEYNTHFDFVLHSNAIFPRISLSLEGYVEPRKLSLASDLGRLSPAEILGDNFSRVKF